MITVVNLVGARPNFMKIAPIHRAMTANDDFNPHLIHTAQHYDRAMSEVFFHDLRLPEPSITLGVGSGTHAEQTARVMLALEPVLLRTQPDVVLVVGDVNSTLAGALTAAKLNIPVAHVEAGLRSRDRTMPEEINRMIADVLSDLLFAPSKDAVDNLLGEGIPGRRIHLVGNVMIDSLFACLRRAEESGVLDQFGLRPKGFFLVTLHRPSNVDEPGTLPQVVEILTSVAELQPVLFAVHPRTADRLENTNLRGRLERAGVILTGPIGYLEFLGLLRACSAVLTDSGGIQEESTFSKALDVDPVCHIEHMWHVVADENYRQPPVPKIPDQLKNLVGFPDAQCRRRLIQHHYLGAEGCSPGHRNGLALATGEVFHRHGHVLQGRDSQPGELLLGLAPHPLGVQHPEDLAQGARQPLLPAQEKIGRDVKGRGNRQVLVHRFNAVHPRILGPLEVHRLAGH